MITLDAPNAGSGRDLARPRSEWELSVFDRAAHFAVVEMRGEREYLRFRVLPWAIRRARTSPSTCLYAVSASGRFSLLDRERWGAWEARWRAAKGLPPDKAPAAPEKLHRGTINEWYKVSAPQGLGYAISGRMGGRGVLTTSVLRRDGDEVETLNWRYTLGDAA